MIRRSLLRLLLLAPTVALTTAMAELRLPAVISDHMVLQADAPAQVWGWADPGETVAVQFGQVHQSTTTGSDGTWAVRLNDLPPTADAKPLTVATDTGTIMINDVVVGEVWLCGGQSNMKFPVRRSAEYEALQAEANRPDMRYFIVERAGAWRPAADLKGQWVVVTPDTVGPFSAVGFAFGLELNQNLDRPIGLIGSNWGGTAAESWTPRPALATRPELARINDIVQDVAATLPEGDDGAGFDAQFYEWLTIYEDFEKQTQEWRTAEPETRGTQPRRPPGKITTDTPSVLFNGMIAPLTPYAIRGVIWYQGERNANVGHGEEYRHLLPALIEGWRQAWALEQLPFYFVQLPNFNAPRPESWPLIRESMLQTWQTTPDTGMAVTIGLGNPDDIHPLPKREIARRLSLIALARTYGVAGVIYSGPVFAHAVTAGSRLQLAFTHADGGLQPVATDLIGFELTGLDGQFHPAEATIQQDRVLVWSKDVTAPTAVRYGWANDARPSLFNGAGLPASPFRAGVTGP